MYQYFTLSGIEGLYLILTSYLSKVFYGDMKVLDVVAKE